MIAGWAAIAALLAPGPAHHRKPPPIVTARGIREARSFAKSREGTVSFAVIGTHGQLRGGYDEARTYPSASVCKAMLMTEVLRNAHDRDLTAYEQTQLEPMIMRSANQPARDLFAQVGSAGLYEIAEAAHMREFSSDYSLFESRISAEDQARFFFKLDDLLPRRHRSYARQLFKQIVPAQRWGIPPAAEARHLTALFKGGWRSDVVHQVARVERTTHKRVALAVLSATTDQGYGRETVAGIAERVLERPEKRRNRTARRSASRRGGARARSRRTGRRRR